MDLEQIAQQAMDYLDSVGVAAEYEVDTNGKYGVTIITDRWSFQFVKHITIDEMIGFIERKIKRGY